MLKNGVNHILRVLAGWWYRISQEVGHDAVKEWFYHVLMDPNQDTGGWAEVWLSSCCRNVSVAAPGGRRRAELEDLGGLIGIPNTNSP